METYSAYVNDIPEEVRLTIASMNNPIRQAILVLLVRNNELSFSNLLEELGINKVKLNFHLKNLFSSALIDHYYRHEVGNPQYSYYSVTPLGTRVLFSLIDSFVPPTPLLEKFDQQIVTSEYTDYETLSFIPDFVDNIFCNLTEKKECHIITDTHGLIVTVQDTPSSTTLGKYVLAK